MKQFDGSVEKCGKLLLSVMAIAVLAACGGGGGGNADPGYSLDGGGPGPAGASPNLGVASPFVLYASQAAEITLDPSSKITGNVGLDSLVSACTGCAVPGVVSGTVEIGTPAALAAKIAFNAAYVDAASRATNACILSVGDLASAQGACAGVVNGPSYAPGLYKFASPLGIGVGSSITLDAKGYPNAVFIFQTDTALTTQTDSEVLLINGAQAKNVWWIIGSQATLGVHSHFKGNVLTNSAAITVNGGTSALLPTLVEGRLLSHGAAITVGAFSTIALPL